MNSEVQTEINTAQAQEALERKEAQKKADAKVTGEASLAQAFERHPFWDMFKRDMMRQREIIIETILTKELTKYKIDQLKTQAQVIKMFIEHPKKYVNNLKAMMQRYTKRV